MKKLSDFPQWIEANNRLQELRGQLSELENEHQAGLLALRDQERRRDALTAKAEALLNGSQPVAGKVVTLADLEDLSERRRIIRKAIELQEQRIGRLRSDLSKQVCEQVRPEYQKIIREMAQIAGRLQGVIEKELSFRRELQDGDISFASHIEPCVIRGMGERRDPYSRVGMFLQEAARAGYIKQAEIEVIS